MAPIVRYDDQYRTDLVGTLEAWLEHNGNMNATAAAIFAHRHTVAYRLERVRELTGLDPDGSEDRERLGLGPEGLPDHRAAPAALEYPRVILELLHAAACGTFPPEDGETEVVAAAAGAGGGASRSPLITWWRPTYPSRGRAASTRRT